MTPKQIAFLDSRRRQIRYWPWLAATLVLALAAAYAWLWQVAPINISPMRVLEQFHARTLADEEMIMLAARGTLALIGCGLFVLVLVLLVSLALWNERRLIRMIDDLMALPTHADGAPATPEPPAPEAPSRIPAGPDPDA